MSWRIFYQLIYDSQNVGYLQLAYIATVVNYVKTHIVSWLMIFFPKHSKQKQLQKIPPSQIQ